MVGAFDHDGTLMGFATYGRFREQPAFQFTVENSIYLDAKYRGKGVGKELMKTIITLAEHQAITP